MRDVFVVGVGLTPFGRDADGSVEHPTAEAVEVGPADASLAAGDLEAVWFANAGWGMVSGQHCVRGHGDRQADGTRIGLTQNSGGVIGTGEAAYSAYIFEVGR